MEEFLPLVFHQADLMVNLSVVHRLVLLDLPVVLTHWGAETVAEMVVMILMILPLRHLLGNVILRSSPIGKTTHYYGMMPSTDCGVTNSAQ